MLALPTETDEAFYIASLQNKQASPYDSIRNSYPSRLPRDLSHQFEFYSEEH